MALLASIGVFRQNYTLQMRSIQHFSPFLELGLGRAPHYFAAENIIHMHFFPDFAVILHNILVVIGLLFFNKSLSFRPGFHPPTASAAQQLTSLLRAWR